MNKDRIIRWLLLAQVFSISLSPFLSVRILVLLILIELVLYSYKYRAIEFAGKSWDSLAYLFVLGIGIIYSHDISVSLQVMESNFCFLAIPIIFFNIKEFDEEKLNQIFIFFIAGLVLACGVCFINAVIQYIQIDSVNVFFSYQFTHIISSHPTYLAYYLIFAITFGLYLLYYKKGKFNPSLLIVIILFLFLALLLTGGQTAFISISFVFSFFLLKFLVEERSVMKTITFSIVCIMIVFMFLVTLIGQKSRDSVLNDSWERFVLWEAAIKATPDVVWGVGTGDYKIILNEYYKTHNLTQFVGDSYNSHNQFIQILLTNGILGLLSVIVLICRPIYLAVKNHDILGILVFFPFIIYGMTEVFLGRYQGIVFFALLHQVFISYYSSQKPSVEHLKDV